MKSMKAVLIINMLFVSLFAATCLYAESVSADIQGGWVEEIIRDVPTTVRGIDIGDVDGDGENEVVVGLGNTATEIRLYEKENGIWKETLLADTPTGLTDLVVGDADNDGMSEIACSLGSGSNEVRMYEFSNGFWGFETVVTAPVGITDIELGDADNDGLNEIVVALQNATVNDVRAYQKLGTWQEENITDAPFPVSTLALGDADNDGNNEVVVGMTGNFPPPFPVYVPNEVRAYEKVGGNWIEDNVTDTSDDDVISLVIGDHDGDGKNEVCLSIADLFTNSEFRTYEYKGTWSMELQYPSAPGSFIFMGGVDDTDNDGITEFITMEAQAMGAGASNMVVWENQSFLFTGNTVRGSLPSRADIVIGDGDNDGTSEIYCGFITTTYEIRSYSNDRGKIRFTSHYDGQYIAGTEIIDVLVTSNFVDAVRFYIDDNLTFTDTKYPFQFVLDTTTMAEDAKYTVKAEGYRSGNPPLVAAIDLTVNNLAPAGDYISAATSKSAYAPDEDVSVLIGLKSPPSFSSLNLIVSYRDPNNNTLYSIEDFLPFSNQYVVILPLGSDAEPGTYTVTVDAYGITQDMLMWSATNTTTFDVAGKSISERLAEINVTMPDVNVTEILDSIDLLNISLSGDIQDLLNKITAEVSGLNGSLSAELSGILENITIGHGSLQTWLDTILTQIDANLTDTRNALETQLTALETSTHSFYDDILVDISEVFNSLAGLEGNLSLQHDAISDAIGNLNTTIADAPGLSTGDILDRINDSIALLEDLDANMTGHDTDIENVLDQLRILVGNEGNITRDELIQGVSEITEMMDYLDAEIMAHDGAVKGNLSTIEDLISNIGAMDIAEIMIALDSLEGNLSSHNAVLASDIADVQDSVAGFQTEVEGRLDRINETLDDLAKLEDIVDELIMLESNVLAGQQQLEDEINEIPTDKEEKESFGMTEGLLVVAILLLLMNLMLTLIGRGKTKEGVAKPLPGEEGIEEGKPGVEEKEEEDYREMADEKSEEDEEDP